MKRMLFLPVALVITVPSIALSEFQGHIDLGIRTTQFNSGESSAKFDEYRDMSDGLFGAAGLFYDTDSHYLDIEVENPGLTDQSLEIQGGKFGSYKATLSFDELTHRLSDGARSPALGIGSNYLLIPNANLPLAVPPRSAWTEFDYEIERQVYGGKVTVKAASPWYYRLSLEQQRHEGTMPWGLFNTSDFELPMPIDYTTNNLMAESGYQGEETSFVLTASFSDFDNDNDLFTTNNGSEIEEYSTAADNYSYNINGRLKQRLPMDSLLALKASYSRHVSETDFSKYLLIDSPTTDGAFDGDITYLRFNSAVTTRWNNAADSRLYYHFIDRSNDSDEITSIDGGRRTNHLYEYSKHQAGFDYNHRLNGANRLAAGYGFTYTDQNREDAETSRDHQIFAQWKNTSIDWVTTKLKIEYVNRSSDTGYRPETLEGDGLIHLYFTPFDYASKDQYRAELSFDFLVTDNVDLSTRYGLEYRDYDTTRFGVQDDQRHEIYLDLGLRPFGTMQLNTFAGYEYTTSDYASRRYNPGFALPTIPASATNFNWTQETSYDFFVVGGSLTIPVRHDLDVILSASYQVVDGNVDFARAAAAGDPLETVKEADDYYRTELGIKTGYQLDENWKFTLGYLFALSNLDEWKYENYTYNPGTGYLSGAGLDQDYEAHQVYLITSYRF